MKDIWHEFKYMGIVFFKTTGYFFWTLMFPIILITMFQIVLQGVDTSAKEGFGKDIPVATENAMAKQVFQGIDLLKVVTTEDFAKNLKDGKIEGYFDQKMHLTITKDTIRTKILQSIGDTVKQVSYLYEKGYRIEKMEERSFPYTKFGQGESGAYISFYSLVAMQSVYSYFNIMSYIDQTLANLSTAGIRSEMGSMKKWKKMTAGYILSFLLGALANLLLIVYAQFILDVPLISDIPRTILIMAAANIFGLGVGSAVGISTKLSSNTKTGIAITIMLVLSAVSGLYGDGLKYFFDSMFPVLDLINPISIISRELYRVNALQMYPDFQKDLLILFSIGFLLIAAALLRTRRRKYDELKSFS